MSETTSISGQCACGSVTLQANVEKKSVGACHCTTCRRWGGGPLLTIDCGNQLSLSGEQFVSHFDSSEWAQRSFCSRCGSHLYYRLKESNLHFVPIGLFGDDVDVSFDHQVFIDEKPDYYDFANKTHNMTGEELFAQYSDGNN